MSILTNVLLYSKPNCPQCDFTKKFLDDHQIAYSTIDVMEDAAALEKVKSLGFQSLPVVVADGMAPFHGFRPDLLENLA